MHTLQDDRDEYCVECFVLGCPDGPANLKISDNMLCLIKYSRVRQRIEQVVEASDDSLLSAGFGLPSSQFLFPTALHNLADG